MRILTDTNVLLRWIDRGMAGHADAFAAVEALLAQGNALCIAPQNCIEFWNVSTRPLDRNGRGIDVSQVSEEIDRLEQYYPLLADSDAIFSEWKRLVAQYSVRGVQVHDARLVAVMRVHGLSHILTFNTTDFARYTEITAMHPRDVRTF